jgi:hypothetical protein
VVGGREIWVPRRRTDCNTLAVRILVGGCIRVEVGDCNPGTSKVDRTRNIRAEVHHTVHTDTARISSVFHDKTPVRTTPDIAEEGVQKVDEMADENTADLNRTKIYVHYRIRSVNRRGRQESYFRYLNSLSS